MAELAADQWGVVSIQELLACGLSRQAVLVRERRGQLHRLHRGVYAVGHRSPSRQGLLLAAVKACGPHAVLSHFSAAEVWGLVEPLDRFPDVTVPEWCTRRRPRIRVHRTASLGRCDLSRRDGIPLTTPVRTVIDLAPLLSHRELRRVVRQGQSVRQVGLRQLTAAVNRLGPRRGVVSVRRIVATGPIPTRSDLEDIVLDLLLAGGLEPPAVNEPLRIEGRWVVPDFRWPEQRLVIEADGGAWHDHKLAREDDADRQTLLEAHGERVLRVTWSQAVAQPARTLTRIRQAGAPRSSRAMHPFA